MPKVFENDLDDLPSGAHKLLNAKKWFFRGLMEAEKKNPGTWKAAVRAYQASASFADAQIGRMLDALEASPYADNTIIVLWSDHGYHLGEKEHWEKFALWEKANHVPFMIAAPGIAKEGGVCEQPVSLLDIYPTLLSLCGLTPRPEVDGLDLSPLLKNPETRWERPAIMTYQQGNHAIRDTRWRYIRYADGTEELYDHQDDPNEWRNLADLPDHEAVKAALRKWIPKTEAPPAPDMTKKEAKALAKKAQGA